MGLEFPNPVGLAAGFDKNGRHIDALASLGFGFIEIGTITPQPQPGNPRPRLFRIPKAKALINRMGFNNDGIVETTKNLEQASYTGIIGISIGKNAKTPLEQAVGDYLEAFRHVYRYANYVALNISSPGTKQLRKLQEPEYLSYLLSTLKEEQKVLTDINKKYVPLVVKLAPDFKNVELRTVAKTLLAHRIDGIIATNTTLSREGVEGLHNAAEDGGLSGAPLAKMALNTLTELNKYVEGGIPIIASGGIMGVEDALSRIEAGASLVQVYTGLVYKGPRLLKDIVNGLNKRQACKDSMGANNAIQSTPKNGATDG